MPRPEAEMPGEKALLFVVLGSMVALALAVVAMLTPLAPAIAKELCPSVERSLDTFAYARPGETVSIFSFRCVHDGESVTTKVYVILFAIGWGVFLAGVLARRVLRRKQRHARG